MNENVLGIVKVRLFDPLVQARRKSPCLDVKIHECAAIQKQAAYQVRIRFEKKMKKYFVQASSNATSTLQWQ